MIDVGASELFIFVPGTPAKTNIVHSNWVLPRDGSSRNTLARSLGKFMLRKKAKYGYHYPTVYILVHQKLKYEKARRCPYHVRSIPREYVEICVITGLHMTSE
jgi:hypothetical protein